MSDESSILCTTESDLCTKERERCNYLYKILINNLRYFIILGPHPSESRRKCL